MVNIIGVFVPKIITLVAVWVYPAANSIRILLTSICLVRCILDYDSAKPGHSGKIYHIAGRMSENADSFIVEVIRLIPTIGFVLIAAFGRAWFALTAGVLSFVLVFVECFEEFKYLK